MRDDIWETLLLILEGFRSSSFFCIKMACNAMQYSTVDGLKENDT